MNKHKHYIYLSVCLLLTTNRRAKVLTDKRNSVFKDTFCLCDLRFKGRGEEFGDNKMSRQILMLSEWSLLPWNIPNQHPVTIFILICKHIFRSMQKILQLDLTQDFLPRSTMSATLTWNDNENVVTRSMPNNGSFPLLCAFLASRRIQLDIATRQRMQW